MKALLQRVSHARVVVDGETIGAIGKGLLVFLGVERGDTEAQADRLLERVLGYRIFSDDEGRMNRSVQDLDGAVLLVSQFTLAADTKKGMRPSFTPAAAPADGERLYDYTVEKARRLHPKVATGRFGADMKIELLNDGPVTFLLEIPPSA